MAPYLHEDEDFCFTYGDGLSDVNISSLIDYHRTHKCMATVTAVKPPGRYGMLQMTSDSVLSFKEKPLGDGGHINGGYFVLSRECLDLIDSDSTVWENEPLEILAKKNNLKGYIHNGFWHAMDTLRDKNYLESLWASGNPPWRVWS